MAISHGADPWDKTTRSGAEWMRALRNDREKGDTLAWTSIPDWVTATLIEQGYDGIHDRGGKMGCVGHDVWIPFREDQVKSVFNRGTWDGSKRSILFSPSEDQRQPDQEVPRGQEGQRVGRDGQDNIRNRAAAEEAAVGPAVLRQDQQDDDGQAASQARQQRRQDRLARRVVDPVDRLVQHQGQSTPASGVRYGRFSPAQQEGEGLPYPPGGEQTYLAGSRQPRPDAGRAEPDGPDRSPAEPHRREGYVLKTSSIMNGRSSGISRRASLTMLPELLLQARGGVGTVDQVVAVEPQGDLSAEGDDLLDRARRAGQVDQSPPLVEQFADVHGVGSLLVTQTVPPSWLYVYPRRTHHKRVPGGAKVNLASDIIF
jgi:hypothetical protein